jgi:cell division protein FtsN
MAREIKSPPMSDMGGPRAAPKKKRMNPLFIGIIIGLLMGVGLAVGLAVWINRANNPFIEKSRPVDALPTISIKSALSSPAPTTPPTSQPSKTESDKPRFEFYQILPGEKGGKGDKGDKAEKSLKPESAPSVKPTEPAKHNASEQKTPSKPDAKVEVKPSATEILHLQVGAFQNVSEADNMKAKVAFAGFEATVRPVNLPDKGTLYRVRLGPFKSLDEVNRIKAALSEGGISAAVVKGSD